MDIAAIIAGAGSGTRLGADKPKALVKLAGEALIVHAVRGMQEAGVDRIVVTIPADSPSAAEDFSAALASVDIGDDSLVLTPGGVTRQESVSLGIAAVKNFFPCATHVLVHDAARALTPAPMIRRVCGLLEAGAAAVIPVLPVVDTIKEISPDPDASAAAALTNCAVSPSYTEKVMRTLERSSLRAVQTPQGFTIDLLERAHMNAASLSASEQSAAPDDAALVELLGEAVRTVPGDSSALKITTPFDLQVAELLMAQRSASISA